MSWYRKVDVRMWGDAKFVALSPRAKFLWFRLLTGPETTSMPGVIPVGRAALAEALGWSGEDLTAAMGEITSKEMAMVDFEARLVFLPRALRYNPPASPNVVRSWRSTWDALPECKLKSDVIPLTWEQMKGMPEGFVEAFRKTFTKSKPYQDQDQDQDQDQKQDQDQDQDQKRERWLPPPEFKTKRQQAIALLPPSPRQPKQRAHRLPPNWKPSTELVTKLREAFEVDPLQCLEAFTDWAASSPKAVKLDWDATFRSWVRREAKDGKLEPLPDPPKQRDLGYDPNDKSGPATEESKRLLREGMARLTQRIDEDNARMAASIGPAKKY